MKGFETMPTQTPQHPEEIKPKIFSTKAVEAPETGKEIEFDLKPVKEQIDNFHISPYWMQWVAFGKSEPGEKKEEVRQKLLTKLAGLEKEIGDNKDSKRAINIIRAELGEKAGHA